MFNFPDDYQSYTLNIEATPALISPNLDILLELQAGDVAGTLIATANPDLALNATIERELLPLPDLRFYIKVKGTGRGTVTGTGYSSYGSIGHYSLNVSILPSFREALDDGGSGLTWASGGNTPWTGQTAVTHDGVDAAQSGTITDSQQSWVETTVTEPGTLSFWWKVSSEANFDYLKFYLNGVLQSGPISGEVNWQQRTFSIPPGNNTLRWLYSKDLTDTVGSDRGWVDEVIFTPARPVITQQPTNVPASVGVSATLAVTTTGYPLLTYQWAKDGVDVGGATNAVLALNNVQTNQAGNYTVVITNTYGSVISSVAVLTVNRLIQTITIASLPVKQPGEAPFTLNTIASSGLPVSYTSSSPGVATVSGNTVTITGLGSATITASQAGDSTYLPATSVSQIILVAIAGKVVAWGLNDFGQTNVPAGLSGVTTLAAGYGHTLALKNEGTVVAWGNNTYGQTNAPLNLSGVTAIAAGAYHTVALKGDGSMVAWGYSEAGETNIPAGVGVVAAIAAGYNHTVVLRSDGRVVAWGYNSSGQTSVPAGLSNVTAIAAGGHHTIALKLDGTVVAWGNNSFGQSNVPAGLSNVMAIAAGNDHTIALQSSGTVVAWGNNYQNQANVPLGLSGVVAIAGGGNHTVALVGTVPKGEALQNVQLQSAVTGYAIGEVGFSEVASNWRTENWVNRVT